MYTISEINGIKIYNLSAGKTLPQFLEEANKRKSSLRYDQDFRRRIELIQDFDFPIASTQVQMTPDQLYIIASGIYPPQIKIFETSQLSLKCMRGIDSEVVKFNILDEDYTKLAFACADRTIEFHAQYGKHYKTRVPKFPRDMVYNAANCDLTIAAAGSEIYRMNLEEGKFLNPLISSSETINTLAYNKNLSLLMNGGSDGLLEIWDYRQRDKIAGIRFSSPITCLSINEDSPIKYAVGNEAGLVSIFDLRYEKSIIDLQHQYHEPIKGITFHDASRNILSADKKILKIFNQDNGKIFTNIEPKEEINSFEVVKNSGLIFIASECVRIGTYFLPALDAAPKWCHYIENVTEELEEELVDKVYDEFKFVSHEDLEKLNATNMIGSKYLKQYMHGYLMHTKLYQKLELINDPFAYEKYRKELVKNKLEEKRKNRILGDGHKKVKVNEEFLKKMEEKKTTNKRQVDVKKEVVESERFQKMFQDPKFTIDVNSEEYLRNNPQRKRNLVGRVFNENDGNDEENEENVEEFQENDLENHRNPIKSSKKIKKVMKINENKITYQEKLKAKKMSGKKGFRKKKMF